ncbi:MAG TPA: hypothetical protein VGG20_00850 [Thermoanaerobaculia bacterium]|jgi:hypothetical protein
MSDPSADLYQAWYDAVVKVFGLSPLTFLMARSLIPLGSTSRDLWDFFDSIPIASDGHYYELHAFNRFSEGYGVVVNLVIPQSGTTWRNAVGDHYGDWVKYLASSPTIPPGGMLELFTVWAEKNIPDPERAQAAITAYQQVLNGVIPVAQDRFIGAGGVYAFSRSIDEARSRVSSGPKYEFSFSSSSNAPPRPAAGPRLRLARLGGEMGGFAESALAKIAASHVEGRARFDHQARFKAVPLTSPEIVGGKPYPGWFSAGALRYAYETKDGTVWPAGMKPTWEQTFGPTGNLQRVATELVLVDGVNVELEAETDLSAGELAALQEAAAAGITPLFGIASPAEMQMAGFRAVAAAPLRLSISAEGSTIKIRIESPLGNAMLFGVVATPPVG